MRWARFGSLLLVFIFQAFDVQAFPCGQTYTVKSGDGCWSIRTAAGLKDSVFTAINPRLNCDTLSIGQTLCISPCQNYYIVKSGDYCDLIRTQQGMLQAEFNSLNPGLNCANLQISEPICVVSCTRFATVVSGDSCYGIYTNAGITSANLARLNPLLDCNGLQIGDKLCTGACAKYVIAGSANAASCWDIQTSNGVESAAALQSMNPGLNCNSLQAGQRVCVSMSAPTPSLTWPPPVIPVLTTTAVKTTPTTTTGPPTTTTRSPTTTTRSSTTTTRSPTTTTRSPTTTTRSPTTTTRSPTTTTRSPTTTTRSSTTTTRSPTTTIISPTTKTTTTIRALTTTTVPIPSTRSTTTTKVTSTVSITATLLASTTIATVTIPRTTTASTSTSPIPVTQLPRPCTVKYKIISGDYCDKVASDNKMTVAKFLELNPGLNCATIAIGQEVCIGNGLTTCPQIYTPKDSDTCDRIAKNYGIATTQLTALNSGLDCTKSISGIQLCVGSNPPSCLEFLTVVQGDTCYDLMVAASLSDEEWLQLNPDAETVCGPGLQVGTQLCTRGPKTGCFGFEEAQGGESCEAMAAKYVLPLEDFKLINSQIDCSNKIKAKESVCTGSKYLQGCRKLVTVKSGDTCESIATAAGITREDLVAANAGVLCSVLKSGQKLCLEPPPLKCTSAITVTTQFANNTCAEHAIRNSVNLIEFIKWNPDLKCDSAGTKTVPVMSLICLAASTGESRDTQLLSSVVSIYSNNPEVKRLLEQYNSNPTDANFALLGSRLLKLFGSTDGRNILIGLEQTDPYFKAFKTEKAPLRQKYCDSTTASNEFDLSSCFCGNSDPLLYCLSLLQEKVNAYLSQPNVRRLIKREMEEEISKKLTLSLIQDAAKANGYDLNDMYKTGQAIRRSYEETDTQNKRANMGRRQPNRTVGLFPRQSGNPLPTQAAKVVGQLLNCDLDGGLAQLFKAVSALTKGPQQALKSLQEFVKDGKNGVPLKDACIGAECCLPLRPIFEVCLGGKVCLGDFETKATIGGLNCNEGFCEPAENNVMSGNVGIWDTSVVLVVKLCIDFPDSVYKIPGVGHVLRDYRCIQLQLKIFFLRGDIDVEFSLNIPLLSLKLSIKALMYLPPIKEACLDNICKKDHCRMEMGKPLVSFSVNVDVIVSQIKVFEHKFTELPDCNEEIEVKMMMQKSEPNPFSGKVVGSYFPNWVAYNDLTLLPRLLEQAKRLTHIFVAFQTISYSIEFDSYYVDFADPWGDMNKCQGLSDSGCHAYNGPEVNYESPDCMSLDVQFCSAGVVAVAPYLGYVGSGANKCPKPQSSATCANSGGVPGLRKTPCYTVLDNANRLPKYNNKPKMCGQFQYLLRQVKSANPNVRIVLSIGGWYDSPYWTLATNSKYIDSFVESIGRWIDVMPFDGVDVDWEFPGFEHGNQPIYPATSAPGNVEETTDCSKSSTCQINRLNDGVQYTNLLRAIRSRLSRSGPNRDGLTESNKVPFEITIAPPIGNDKLVRMDLQGMCQHLDYINMMAYDLHGAWDPITNHQAHMYDKDGGYEIDFAVKYFLSHGCRPSQLVLGVPFYGRALKGVEPGPNPKLPGLYQPHTGVAYNEQGVLSYGEIMDLINQGGWGVYWDDNAKASYAYNPSQKIFISFDDENAVRFKTSYIANNTLGGAMYWLMGQDDKRNTLLNTLYEGLRGEF